MDICSVVYFVNSGSEANDLALLMAREYTKNFDILGTFYLRSHNSQPFVTLIMELLEALLVSPHFIHGDFQVKRC